MPFALLESRYDSLNSVRPLLPAGTSMHTSNENVLEERTAPVEMLSNVEAGLLMISAAPISCESTRGQTCFSPLCERI